MINEDMVLLRSWLSANMLALNVEKTNFILFERRSAIRLSDNHVVLYGDGIVQREDTIKYLVLYLDTKLDFFGHIRHIMKKILPIMFALRRLRHLITYNTAMSIIICISIFSATPKKLCV
jgi:hypothetical protein